MIRRGKAESPKFRIAAAPLRLAPQMSVAYRHLWSFQGVWRAAAIGNRKRSKPRFYSDVRVFIMNGEKDHLNMSQNAKAKTAVTTWRQMSTQSCSNKVLENMNSDDGCEGNDKYHGPTTVKQDVQQPVGLVGGTTGSSHSDADAIEYRHQHLVNEAEVDLYQSVSVESNSPGELNDVHSSSLGSGIEIACGAEKNSISIEIGAPLIRFVKGKLGFTQRQIEKDAGVKLIFPPSKRESFITIEGSSVENVQKASEIIKNIIEKAAKSRSLDYSHFVSLPLAVHGELVEKLIKFQTGILGDDNVSEDGETDCNPEENTLKDKEDKEIQSEGANSDVKLAVQQDNHVNVELATSVKSYEPKQLGSPSLADLRIEKSIFIKPSTLHLTVLMLKLYNKDRIALATEVLQSVSSKVKDSLDGRPISIRLKGLACMRGSPAKAQVIYAPVEEIGNEGRLLRACKVIIDAYIEAGLVSKDDVREGLKLHATVMNVRHRKRKKHGRNFDSFDAREIFKTYGSIEWGDYLIKEAHLSQRFKFDERGYYHCCNSIPFPEDA